MLFVSANTMTSTMFNQSKQSNQTKTKQTKQTKQGKITIIEDVDTSVPRMSHLDMLDMTARSQRPSPNQTTIDGILVVKKVRPMQTSLPHPLPTLSAHTCERCMLRPQNTSASAPAPANFNESQQTSLEGLLIRLVLAIIGLEPVPKPPHLTQEVGEVEEVEIDTYGKIRGRHRQPRHVVERAM